VRAYGAVELKDGHSLLILQHPQTAPGRVQEPLKLAVGPFLAYSADRRRLLHQVNTMPGSSGSPCLDAALGLAGLHVHGAAAAGEPGDMRRCNGAVAVGAIRGDLVRIRGDASALTGEA
jgi:hypothetical protein